MDPGSDTIHSGRQGCEEQIIFFPMRLIVKCHRIEADIPTGLLTARAGMRFCTICFLHSLEAHIQYTHAPSWCNGSIKTRRFHSSAIYSRERKDFIFQFNLKHHFTSLFAEKILYCPETWASSCLIPLEWILLFLSTS